MNLLENLEDIENSNEIKIRNIGFILIMIIMIPIQLLDDLFEKIGNIRVYRFTNGHEKGTGGRDG